MNPEPGTASQALESAKQALRQGDRVAARRWAEQAVNHDPGLEEGWLILAAVASPRASVAYLDRALQINPTSLRAQRGMQWAQARLLQEKEKKQAKTEPAPEPVIPEAGESSVGVQPEEPVASKAVKGKPSITRMLKRFRWLFIAFLILLLCIAAAISFWPGNAATPFSFLNRTPTLPVYGGPGDVEKPTYTPTFTATFTSTPTNTFTPTFTATFTPTNTPTPTDTPEPTRTPFLPPTEEPTDVPYVDTGGVRWIDVDLSQQMLYAYEGDTIVASFLVSTGVPAFPTVVGQFHVYMKFEYTLMAGDGYYLPDVPYTMYFYKGYGIHGTYWHNNFGTPMSHGCVNMYTPDAQWLFYWAPMGILVNVHY